MQIMNNQHDFRFKKKDNEVFSTVKQFHDGFGKLLFLVHLITAADDCGGRVVNVTENGKFWNDS